MTKMNYEGKSVVVENAEILNNLSDLVDAIKTCLHKNAGYREKEVIDNLHSVELAAHGTDPVYITADLYNKEGEGIQIIVNDVIDNKNRVHHRRGDITG